MTEAPKIQCNASRDTVREPKRSYYQRNKHHYQKGGKYYRYTPKSDRTPAIKVAIKRGEFILSFD